ALSYARIHRQNLVNAGILPLIFESRAELEALGQGDRLALGDIHRSLEGEFIEIRNLTKGRSFRARHGLSRRQAEILLAGGALNAARKAARDAVPGGGAA
ncbi:MAG TPA: hypothetical protein PLB91_15620, partial [Spirochaetales bacterium]|nr:hypothetical protein [Spirochaetales bacterium]